MKYVSKIIAIIAMACLLVMAFPISSFAVDPVSATVMANAAAQAIAAYGASQGVSMAFDVSNTDGVGESVHELWNNFVEDNQNANLPTYNSFAVNIWTGLFSKIGDKVAINLSTENVEIVNQFWDWLLSGPAEMQKVDNQYYEFSLNQQNTVTPINIYNSSGLTIGGYPFVSIPHTFSYSNGNDYSVVYLNQNYTDGYIASWTNGSSYFLIVIGVKDANIRLLQNGNNYQNTNLNNPSAYNIGYNDVNFSFRNPIGDVPLITDYTQQLNNPSDFFNFFGISQNDMLNSIAVSDSESLSVKPYGDSLSVSFPTASPYTGTLDDTWDTTLYGDGAGTLTDAQSTAISNSLAQTIAQTGELTLDSVLDIDASEVYIPFLPITLPSFNFSLSGIWHYVVTWVESLGAWLSTMFTAWSVVPVAITVPVYATAVIVIVLGVYKRFFM